MDQTIERFASSIVREFLNRKKCMMTLKQMDDEWPRDDSSISNRTKLAQALCIEPWMKKNKADHPSFKTMLEVILYNILVMNKSLLQRNNIEDDTYTAKKEPFTRPHTAQPSARSRALQKDLSFSNKVEQIDSVEDLTVEDLNTIEPMTQKTFNKSDNAHSSKLADRQGRVMDVEKGEKMEKTKVSHRHKQNTPFSQSRHSDRDTLHAQSLLDFLTDNSESAVRSSGIKPYQSALGSPADGLHKLYNNWPQYSNSASEDHGKENLSSQQAKRVIYDFETAKQLRQLIFGSQKHGFRSEWTDQGFSFCDCLDRPELLRFGIVQKKGGPCGVLAVVQSIVLKHLLFSYADSLPLESCLNVGDADRSNCLVKAITEMLWRAGENKFAVLAVLLLRKQFTALSHEYHPDGVSEFVAILNFTSLSDLQAGVKEHIQSYENGKGSCILLLYSAILSRGIDAVKSDLDEPNGKLMGSHGYCTQEMINLLCIGRATSNAFNDSLKLDETTLLRGVHMQSDIGLLSLFEHYRSCQIGSYYKIPKYPIWLICSESHFTVLFGLDKKLVSQYSCPKIFDLYYYDGLANQDEVIRISVDTLSKVNEAYLNGDLVPPLEHCIRTKWPRATIDWNETDPIL